MIDNPREYETMAHVETEHWWYQSLHSRVQGTLADHFGRCNIAILDAGCGTGGLMKFLSKRGFNDLAGFDLSELAVQHCVNRGLTACVGDLGRISNLYPGRQFDCIVSNDTLYHVPADQRVQFLRQAAGRLKTDGILILNLPALHCLRGSHDKAVGITHRFTKPEITTLASQAGLAISKMDYWPFVLSLPIWLVRTSQRLLRRDRGEAGPPVSDLKTYPPMLNRLLRNLIALEKRFLPAAPFGSSLFVVLKTRERKFPL